MRLITNNIKEDSSRDIFWQKSILKNNSGKLLGKIIVFTVQDFLEFNFKKSMANSTTDGSLGRWFENKTRLQYIQFQTVLLSSKSKTFVCQIKNEKYSNKF